MISLYVLSPWKQDETGPRILGEHIFQALPVDSVLFADYSIYEILRYLQVVEHARPDVTLVNLSVPTSQVATILEYRGKPNLFLADTYRYYDIQGIQEYFTIVPAPPIYRLDARQ